MNLKNKKRLAARVFGVGSKRIFLDENRKEDLSEAITRQDIKDLKEDGAIKIKEKTGRRKKKKRTTKKRDGRKKKRGRKLKKKKQDVKITRKLRRYIKNLRKIEKIDRDQYYDIRKKIKTRRFKSLRQLKNYVEEL